MFRRGTTIGTTLALLAALTVLPSASVQAEPVEPPAACGGLTQQFQAEAEKAKSSLIALPPDPAAATKVIGSVVPVVTAMQGVGCLPAVPPTGDTPVTACTDAVADLLAKLFGVIAALVSTGLPDIPKALTELTALLTTLAKLITEKCLPAPPVS